MSASGYAVIGDGRRQDQPANPEIEPKATDQSKPLTAAIQMEAELQVLRLF